jgi:hypothetical protein
VNRKCGLSWVNHVDAAVLAASSQSPGLPVGNLQLIGLKPVWRSAGMTTVWLTAALPASRPIGVLGVFGCNASDAAVWRWRLSSTADHTGDLYDTGEVEMNRALILGKRGQAVHLLSDGAITAQFLKLDLIDGGLSYLEAGKLWAGELIQFERNFSYGQAPKVGDDSVTTPSFGGVDYTDVRAQYMTDSFTLPALTEDELQQKIQDLDWRSGTAGNVLWLPTPGGTYQNAQAILGRMTALAPAPSVAHATRSRQFQIKERL